MDGQPTMFACDGCGKKYRWKAELAGKRVKCACGAAVRVPGEAGAVKKIAVSTPAVAKPRAVAPPAARAKAKPVDSDPDMGAYLVESAGPVVKGKRCLSCKAAMAEDATLCVHCGYNAATGQKLAGVVKPAAAEPGEGDEKKKRGKGVKAGGPRVAMVACLTGAVIAGVAWAWVAKVTGFEFKFVAIGVGFLAGLPILLLADKGSEKLGITAGGCALVGMLIGKLLIAEWALPSWVAEYHTPDAEFIEGSGELVAWDLARQAGDKEAADAIVESAAWLWKSGDEPVMGEGVGERIEQFYAQATQQLEEKKVDVSKLQGLSLQFTGEVLERLPTGERLKSMVRFLDLIFLAAAVSTAYKLGAGFGGEKAAG